MSSSTAQLNVSLIVDSEYISKWEYDAIVYAASRSNIKIHSVLYCSNSTTNRHYVKHFLYFALNVIAMRNKWTKKTAWSISILEGGKKIEKVCLIAVFNFKKQAIPLKKNLDFVLRY